MGLRRAVALKPGVWLCISSVPLFSFCMFCFVTRRHASTSNPDCLKPRTAWRRHTDGRSRKQSLRRLPPLGARSWASESEPLARSCLHGGPPWMSDEAVRLARLKRGAEDEETLFHDRLTGRASPCRVVTDPELLLRYDCVVSSSQVLEAWRRG